MNFESCELYKLKRKRDLYHKLNISRKEIKFLTNKYDVYINKNNRLIEAPICDLKKLQLRLLNKLYAIQFDNYVFSGVKGKSTYDNALQHIKSKYMLKLDMSKFFPNTHRDKIYKFFREKLQMSSDVAKICTDISTVNYNNTRAYVERDVFKYMKIKKIRNKNHLPTGTPTSQIISFLANLDMFEKIKNYCNVHKMQCTIYVDDFTISTNRKISFKEEQELKNIIKHYGHKLSKSKTIRYDENEFKKVTGFVISPNRKMVLANKTKNKIRKKLEEAKRSNIKLQDIDPQNRNSLLGLIRYSRLVNKSSYLGLEKQLSEN